ncbi:hypothetical protein Tco_0067059 [Tanacetum coccineum]
MIVDVDSSVMNYMTGHILHVYPTQAGQASAQEQQYQLYLTIKDNPQLDQDDPQDDAHPEGENSAKRQKTSEHETYDMGESSSGQANENEPDKYATYDDELPTEYVSQELMENVSEIVDEAKLCKVVDEMLRQRCTSGDEHQDPKAPALSLVNQDLLYLKKANSGAEKIVLSLHKFCTVIFPDDDIEERTSRWVDKCVKKFNPYARYSVEHWKNPHAKIFYIKRQKELGNSKEEVYLNSKIVQLSRLMVGDYAETGLLWSLSVFIRSTVICEKVHDFQLVYGITYKNNKKEKRVMRHQEIHKFCDATLKRVLEGLKSYNNDVKHGYVTLSLSKEDVEYLQLFEEEIEERLKHRD